MRGWLVASCLVIAVGPAWADDAPAPPAPTARSQPTFWVVPHSHWEGAVFKTREGYLEIGLPNIAKALRLLREQPSYRYTIDQVAYIRPFLERYPEHLADFKRFMAEGRLQVVGGLDVMPDVNMPGGETFVRQMRYGKGYLREALGIDVTTGWLIDTFGHNAQLPQLLSQAGFKTFWFVRGVPRQDHPAEFLWEGIDGTRIPSFYLPHSYVVMYPTPKTLDAFKAFARQRFDVLTPNVRGGGDRVGVSAADVSEPEEHQAPLIEAANRSGELPFQLRLGTPADFERAVTSATDPARWPVFRGELNPIFQGTYSSRIELKLWMRQMETRLLNLEKTAALAGWLGAPVNRNAVLDAWEPVLFNETHDLASGVMTDDVYDDTIRGYEYSRHRAEDLTDRYWRDVARNIDTSGSGAPVVVFNTLGWKRNDLAQVDLAFTEGGVTGVAVTDDAGTKVPAQILESTRYFDGGLRTARVGFVARDVPAVGYRTYHVTSLSDPAAGKTTAPPGSDRADNVLANEQVRVTVDRASGAITGLRLVSDGWEALSGPGNVVVREVDRGDLWEPYRGLDGASRVAMTTKRVVPAPGQAVRSDEEKAAAPGAVKTGPVVTEFQVAHPLGSGTFATTVRVVAGLRRVEVVTRLVNREKFVRYTGVFPTSVKEGKSVHEIPFGSIERPDAIEFPAQNWVDHGDGRHGLAILNAGLPGNAVAGGTMLVSLMRAHALGAYGFGGGYEPGMSAESGYQIGRERLMRYALVPHAADWVEAGIVREGLEFNHPLICRKVEPHPGRLPARWGLLEISAPGVVLSALRPGPNGALLARVYEAAGQPARNVTLSFPTAVTEAAEVNLMDDPGRPLGSTDRTVQFDLRPFEIKTLQLRLEAPAGPR